MSEFLPENLQFLEVKFSIYLNRRVFIILGHATPCVFGKTEDNEDPVQPLILHCLIKACVVAIY